MDPIFGLCEITTQVVVTQRFGEARESVLTRDLSGVDGIVVVGGDGTFGDVAQGLLERSQRDAGMILRCDGEEEGGVEDEGKEAEEHKGREEKEREDGDQRRVEDVETADGGEDSDDFSIINAKSFSSSSSSSSSKEKPLQSFVNLSTSKFVTNSIPIGHIPGGSGNAFATTATGIHDPASSAILIALGKIMFTDVMAVARLKPSSIMVTYFSTAMNAMY